MEHPCAHCGALVEDGRPFCPHCRAPQVRVLVEPQASAPAAGGFSYADASSLPPATRERFLERKSAVRAALLAGVLGVFIASLIPFLGIVITGALAIVFYRWFGGIALPTRVAARLGAAAGTVYCAIASFFVVVSVVTSRAQIQDQMVKRIQAMGADLSLAEIQEMVRFIFSPPGLALSLALYFGITLVLAAIGGAVAAHLGKPRD